MESQVVALYRFDPATIDWPFQRQKPLALQVGQTINVLHDDGSEWALGALISDPNQSGYFPKNYTVTLNEYYELMKEYEERDDAEKTKEEELPAPILNVSEPPSSLSSNVSDAVPSSGSSSVRDPPRVIRDDIWKAHPPLSAEPPIQTTFSAVKSKLLSHMPALPETELEEGGLVDDLQRALQEAEQGVSRIVPEGGGGRTSDSRVSTPATYSLMRPDKDFVRKHMSVEQQENFLSEVSGLEALVDRNIRLQGRVEPAPYMCDMRVRSTTCRMAANIEPPHMRMALRKARDVGARWTQLFRPELNDIVNESLKMGCNACILSNLYLYNYHARERFQRLRVIDDHGTLALDLQRKKKHLFYMRMDSVDIMMFHPDAWGFPDADHVIHNPGEGFDPFHGWLTQTAIDADRELEDVLFSYRVRIRSLPEHTFQAIALGKMPEWIAPFGELRAEIKEVPLPEIEYGDSDGDGAHSDAVPRGQEPAWAKPLALSEKDMMAAGLAEEEDVYVKVNDIHMAKERTVGPDVLDLKVPCFKVKGMYALRLLLRSQGNPDGTKNVPITPKQVKDMAFQLGIFGNCHFYWYCLFALRFALPKDYDVVVREDTRWYLNLNTDTVQPIHPLITMFHEHLEDCRANDFLWDYRGFVKMKCSDCGLPDAVLWCQQCTDYFCINCFSSLHRSKRGKKHWPLPIPGCRYLTRSEVRQISDHIPLLNVGFCNRRRFLARTDQSDKMGACQCKWLCFEKDTFQSALDTTPEKHWQLKRRNPPRLSPGAEGYYYDFANQVIGDDPGTILMQTQEQRALRLIQKSVRGSIVRKRIRAWCSAALTIQKYKRMWDCQKFYGKHGSNALILRGWYRKFKARAQKQELNHWAARIQSLFRGRKERFWLARRQNAAMKLQAMYHAWGCRRHIKKVTWATGVIQQCYRRHLYGTRPVAEMHAESCRIASFFRGYLVRKKRREASESMIKLQARVRGVQTRMREKRRHRAATKIQASWRRFQSELNLKIVLYGELELQYKERQDLMRSKLSDLAALLIQRTFRRYRDHQFFVSLRREKTDADKRTSTVLVAFLMASTNCGKYVHPWMRHLPAEIQEVLEQIKASLQRSIALVHARGKLTNEEVGKNSRRTTAKDLVLDMGDSPDLASQMLLNIVHHLLSHVPNDVFAETIKWTCYSLGHTATVFVDKEAFSLEDVELGGEVNPRPGDPFVTFWNDKAHIRHHHDRLITVAPENMYLLILKNTPAHLRHVFLTAQTLITARQALDLPSLSTDDHLAFQGLDATVGTQLQDVLSTEIGHRLPSDWPRTHGTVHALATQTSKHILELVPQEKVQSNTKVSEVIAKAYTGGAVTHFNRHALLRILQQTAYYMRNQDQLLKAICSKNDKESKGYPNAVRQSRFVSVVDKLFDIAYKAKHDHCPFVLSVVLFHMITRALMLRVVYHRAAVTIQTQYRHVKTKGRRNLLLRPTLKIQRVWRGTRTALRVVLQHDAAEKIQRNYRARRIRNQNAKLLAAVLRAQRVFRGTIARKWMTKMHKTAVMVQKYVRGMLVRVAMDKEGRRIAAKFKQEGLDIEASSIAELLAKKASLLGRTKVALHRHRERNVDICRMVGVHGTSKHARMLRKANMNQCKGTVQPVRSSVFEPVVFAIARARALPTRYAASKSSIMSMVENAKRELDKDLPQITTKMNASLRRGRQIMIHRRIAKRGLTMTDPEESLLDMDKLSTWETRQFKTSIPWMPKTVAWRLTEHREEKNLRATYWLSTAFVGGYLSRNDEVVPPWYPRVCLVPPTTLAPNMQEHMVQACRVVCAKLLQDTTHVKPKITTWQAGLLCARHLWRAIFTTCAAKLSSDLSSLPVLWMSCCESILSSFRHLLSLLWLETEKQFTTKENRYRGLKSRPSWQTMQGVQYHVLAEQGGFNLRAYNNESGNSKAASLTDFLEEVMALRFGVDWMAMCLEDGEEYISAFLKRRQKAKAQQRKMSKDKLEQAEAEMNAFPHVDSLVQGLWTDDSEIRSITKLVAKLVSSVEGNEAHLQATTLSCQLLLAVWKGAVNLFKDGAMRAIDQMSPTHATSKKLPTPSPKDCTDALETQKFHITAYSYDQQDVQDAAFVVRASPAAITTLIIKVQSRTRSFLLQKRHLTRMKFVAAYCQTMDWPQKEIVDEQNLFGKKHEEKNNIPLDYKPHVSKYLGGPQRPSGARGEDVEVQPEREPDSRDSLRSDASKKVAAVEPELRITADHRACADFFATFMLNMYRRREMANMYRELSFAYEESLDTFGELLVKNPSLRPMVDSVAAQLKRGCVVGFDKAFKPTKGDEARTQQQQQQAKIRPVDSELFRRQPAQVAVTKKQDPAEDPEKEKEAAALEEDVDANISGDYLSQYLAEMGGDDSQFKDIDSSVIPLSTGTSPRRERPDEFLIRQENAEGQTQRRPLSGASGTSGLGVITTETMHDRTMVAAGGHAPTGTPRRPKIDVRWCMKHLQPMWLPIKAHRFTAYRSKILQVLPQKILAQYVEHEKQGHYPACVKLLESATCGSLNVFQPNTLIHNKPLLVETVYQLLVGYVGLCLKNEQLGSASRLCLEMLSTMRIALRELHPAHRTVVEACLYETALSVTYYASTDVTLAQKAESFFQQASSRYLQLKHANRYAKCCVRYASVLARQQHYHEAEYFIQQALNHLVDAPSSSLLVVCYHNLAVKTMLQHRLPDSMSHLRNYISLLRQLPKFSNHWMQKADNTQWLLLKIQEMWPKYQHEISQRQGLSPN